MAYYIGNDVELGEQAVIISVLVIDMGVHRFRRGCGRAVAGRVLRTLANQTERHINANNFAVAAPSLN